MRRDEISFERFERVDCLGTTFIYGCLMIFFYFFLNSKSGCVTSRLFQCKPVKSCRGALSTNAAEVIGEGERHEAAEAKKGDGIAPEFCPTTLDSLRSIAEDRSRSTDG